jgi:hypothetical protein
MQPDPRLQATPAKNTRGQAPQSRILRIGRSPMLIAQGKSFGLRLREVTHYSSMMFRVKCACCCKAGQALPTSHGACPDPEERGKAGAGLSRQTLGVNLVHTDIRVAPRGYAMKKQVLKKGYRASGVKSSRDILLLGLDSGERSLRETIAKISDKEYSWEPIPSSEQASDIILPPHQKRVWRVFQQEGIWIYDYTPEELNPSPFTTIAWIMNHIAQTADMYLYCIKTGKPEGVDRRWEDLPVPSSREAMSHNIIEVLTEVRDYLISIQEEDIDRELNKLTPAPWGEMRPTYLNIWGGIIEHVIQHSVQIAARIDGIRYGY